MCILLATALKFIICVLICLQDLVCTLLAAGLGVILLARGLHVYFTNHRTFCALYLPQALMCIIYLPQDLKCIYLPQDMMCILVAAGLGCVFDLPQYLM